MKNKEFCKLLKKNKFKPDSGFTLTELLVGLIMSIFVIGALGFGLVTVLQTTQRENSKAAARTENSRALDFISDELRRTRNIETDASNAGTAYTPTDKTVVLALEIPEISDGTTAASANRRIVYYLKSTNIGSWKGPQVLYRWGPPLDANGNYTTGTWAEEALIDGINDTTVSNPCTTGTVTPANPTGFYACISRQDSTTAYDANNNPNNTAQLFLTGQTKVAVGVNDSQTNDTQVVTRARTALGNNIDENSAVNWTVEGLGGSFNCTPPNTMWDMETDFTNDPSDPSKTTSWVQTPGVPRQAQPIEIDDSKPLTITSEASGHNPADCLNNPIPVTHVIDFDDPTTFNGDHETDAAKNVSIVGSDEAVQFFKKGFDIPDYGGYSADGGTPVDGVTRYQPSEGDQPTLGRFLYDQGLAIPINDGRDFDDMKKTFRLPTALELKNYLDSSTLTAAEKAKFKVLGDDQRIIGFEMGDRTDTNRPGFDLQDNIFVVTSNVFKKKFPASDFP